MLLTGGSTKSMCYENNAELVAWSDAHDRTGLLTQHTGGGSLHTHVEPHIWRCIVHGPSKVVGHACLAAADAMSGAQAAQPTATGDSSDAPQALHNAGTASAA